MIKINISVFDRVVFIVYLKRWRWMKHMNWLLAQVYYAAGIKQIEIDLENQLLSQEHEQGETKQTFLPDESHFMAPTGHVNSTRQCQEPSTAPDYKIFCPAPAPPPCNCTESRLMHETEYLVEP